jgi:RNase P subunit RPR2
MAKVDHFQSRLDFLKEAAHLLAIQSPTTSAAMGAAHDKLLMAQEVDLEAPTKEWNALRREVCGACGNLLVPGWSCKVIHQTRSRNVIKKEKGGMSKSNSSVKPEKDVVYSCLRCNRKTIHALLPRSSKHTRPKTHKIGLGSHLDASVQREKDTEVVTKSANANSKQRKKTRKGGLQALLDKNKTQPSGSLGLDLMDFMQ